MKTCIFFSFDKISNIEWAIEWPTFTCVPYRVSYIEWSTDTFVYSLANLLDWLHWLHCLTFQSNDKVTEHRCNTWPFQFITWLVPWLGYQIRWLCWFWRIINPANYMLLKCPAKRGSIISKVRSFMLLV